MNLLKYMSIADRRESRWKVGPVHLLLLAAAVVIVLTGCRQSAGGVAIESPNDDAAPGIQIILDEAASGKPVIGSHQMAVTLLDGDGAPIEDAVVTVRGDMNHAGMLPVETEATHRAGGVYDVAIEWTMAGDWIVTVTARLADGRVKMITRNITVTTR